jgi:menaquinone-dependent protoporphyrinogen oxidase
MTRILIVFSTTEGHTAKIARTFADQLALRGHSTTVADAADEAPDPGGFDAIVVTASVHLGSYRRHVVGWVRQHASVLNRVPTAFVSVCLGVLQHDPKVDRDLQKILDAFLHETGWHPLETKIVAGALKYTKYNVLVRWLMKRIARKAGGSTDTSKDHEYTDWEDLRRFADAFATRIESSATAKTA